MTMVDHTHRPGGSPSRYLTYKQAAKEYAVSVDWLRRNRAIRKTRLGRRQVRIARKELELYFMEHTD